MTVSGRFVQVTRERWVPRSSTSFGSDGLRVGRKVMFGGSVISATSFVYDEAGRLLEEYDRTGGTPALRARYYYLDDDSPVAADLFQGGSVGQLKRYYYLKDNIQSVVAIADQNGNVVERVWYDPFGQPVLEQPTTAHPVISSIVGASDGSLLVVMSEPVYAFLNDPGIGTGIVPVTASLGNVIGAVDATNQTAITGTTIVDRSVPGFAAGSVLRFTPSQTVTNSLSITLAGQAIVGEWGNTNTTQTVGVGLSNNVTGGKVYYTAPTQTGTGPALASRSSIGSPFLFQGQYFDYDAGLMYLRARFYDPASGMFYELDPSGYEDSVNLCAAFGENPTTLRDPSGRVDLNEELAKILAGTVRKTEATAAREAERVLLRTGEAELDKAATTSAKDLFAELGWKSKAQIQAEAMEAKVLTKAGKNVTIGVNEGADRTLGSIRATAVTRSAEHYMDHPSLGKEDNWLENVEAATRASSLPENPAKIFINVNGFSKGKTLMEKYYSAVYRGRLGFIERYTQITGEFLNKRQEESILAEVLETPGYVHTPELGGIKQLVGKDLTHSATDIEMYYHFKFGSIKNTVFVSGLEGEEELFVGLGLKP